MLKSRARKEVSFEVTQQVLGQFQICVFLAIVLVVHTRNHYRNIWQRNLSLYILVNTRGIVIGQVNVTFLLTRLREIRHV